MDESLPIIVSCEHAGRRLPRQYRDLFRGAQSLLESHRGWDPGALSLARSLAATLAAPLTFTTITRLLADCNRSPGHPRLFGERVRALPRSERETILARHHHPYRVALRQQAEAAIHARGGVVHLSVHSFVPVLKGRLRPLEIGLLYDPARAEEAALCKRLRTALRLRFPLFTIRRNYPYRGVSDGVTAWLRRLLDRRYLGIELEINQRIPLTGEPGWSRFRRALAACLAQVLLESNTTTVKD